MRFSRDEAVLTLSKWLHDSVNLILTLRVATIAKIARDRSAGTVLASSLPSITEVIRQANASKKNNIGVVLNGISYFASRPRQA
jgi:hypothetical protein